METISASENVQTYTDAIELQSRVRYVVRRKKCVKLERKPHCIALISVNTRDTKQLFVVDVGKDQETFLVRGQKKFIVKNV